MTLAHIFAHNSKSISLQSASFSHAGTHIYMHSNVILNKYQIRDDINDFSIELRVINTDSTEDKHQQYSAFIKPSTVGNQTLIA